MLNRVQYQSFLDNFNRYVQLTSEEESILLPRLKTRTFLKGQYIAQGGDVYKLLTYVLKGKVRTFYLDRNGHEHIVSFGVENWWVGDLSSFMSQAPADYDVQCLEKTEVVQFSYDQMEQLFRDLPKMERFFRLVLQNAYIKSQKRIVRNHSLSARERYLLFCEEYPEMVERFPQYMIASYLGITKEFLSNIRKQLSKELKS